MPTPKPSFAWGWQEGKGCWGGVFWGGKAPILTHFQAIFVAEEPRHAATSESRLGQGTSGA